MTLQEYQQIKNDGLYNLNKLIDNILDDFEKIIEDNTLHGFSKTFQLVKNKYLGYMQEVKKATSKVKEIESQLDSIRADAPQPKEIYKKKIEEIMKIQDLEERERKLSSEYILDMSKLKSNEIKMQGFLEELHLTINDLKHLEEKANYHRKLSELFSRLMSYRSVARKNANWVKILIVIIKAIKTIISISLAIFLSPYFEDLLSNLFEGFEHSKIIIGILLFILIDAGFGFLLDKIENYSIWKLFVSILNKLIQIIDINNQTRDDLEDLI